MTITFNLFWGPSGTIVFTYKLENNVMAAYTSYRFQIQFGVAYRGKPYWSIYKRKFKFQFFELKKEAHGIHLRL